MGNSGVEYMTSKEGILRAVIIVVAIIAFALVASTCGCRDELGWILTAYILAFLFSFLSYICIATTLSSKMQCGVAYETIDVCLSIFHFFHCFLASMVLATRLFETADELIAADIFGFILAILYAVEVYFLKGDAPANFGYLIEPRGILKCVIFFLGCTTFALLDIGGYAAFDNGCDAGRTWAFAAYIYCWIVSTVLLLLRLIGLDSKIGPFDMIDMIWDFFSFFNYLVASIVLAAYMECDGSSNSRRIAACVFGFFVTILYLIDGIMGLKGGKGVQPS